MLEIIYTDDIPQQYAGYYDAPWTIKIRPAYRHDEGILKHEMEHYSQFLNTLGLHPLLYKFSKRYRLWSEVAAYKVQLQYNPNNIELFAEFISTRYELNITKEEALKLLA